MHSVLSFLGSIITPLLLSDPSRQDALASTSMCQMIISGLPPAHNADAMQGAHLVMHSASQERHHQGRGGRLPHERPAQRRLLRPQAPRWRCPPTDAAMPGVYPQQIPAIATGQSGAPNSTSVVPQTTLGATNSSLPATASQPPDRCGLAANMLHCLYSVQQHHGLLGSSWEPVESATWQCSSLSHIFHRVPQAAVCLPVLHTFWLVGRPDTWGKALPACKAPAAVQFLHVKQRALLTICHL